MAARYPGCSSYFRRTRQRSSADTLYIGLFLLYNFRATRTRNGGGAPITHPAFEPLRASLHDQWEQTLADRAGVEDGGPDQSDTVLEILTRRLKALQEQAAYHGIDCPPATKLEIEDLQKKIAKLTG